MLILPPHLHIKISHLKNTISGSSLYLFILAFSLYLIVKQWRGRHETHTERERGVWHATKGIHLETLATRKIHEILSTAGWYVLWWGLFERNSFPEAVKSITGVYSLVHLLPLCLANHQMPLFKSPINQTQSALQMIVKLITRRKKKNWLKTICNWCTQRENVIKAKL